MLGALGARIREEQDRPGVNEEVLSVARIEAAFLEAKQCVVFFQVLYSCNSVQVLYCTVIFFQLLYLY